MTTKTVEILKNRRTSKHYVIDKDLTSEQIDQIADAARFVPSSFGAEPYRLLILKRNSAIKEKLTDLFYKQLSFQTASIVCIWIAWNHNGVQQKLEQSLDRLIPENLPDVRKNYYNGAIGNIQLNQQPDFGRWAEKQAYISLSAALICAGEMDIDVTPCEGFNRDAVTKLLAQEGLLDINLENVAVAASIGYRDKSDPRSVFFEKVRKTKDEFVDIK